MKICAPLFPASVLIVFLESTKEKMVWIATSGIITFMANAKLIWNCAMRNYPCNSMRGVLFSLIIKMTIPHRVFSRKPIPTIFRAAPFYLFPKSIFKRNRRPLIVPKSISFVGHFDLSKKGAVPDISGYLVTENHIRDGMCNLNKMSAIGFSVTKGIIA